ncbi:unnamed protein product [Microthlaspi erraticum]|uniref:Uncharacterized protein n=1 Tax=Microthlaspi erraticum TaxID=1685480 RepID=A0A6D2JKQ8_9BRAS|nr:unnamed protein product [Microthlaspi erraticum]
MFNAASELSSHVSSRDYSEKNYASSLFISLFPFSLLQTFSDGNSSFDELGSVVLFTTIQGAVRRNMVESLVVPTFKVGYTINTDAFDALYKKVDIYSLSRKWKELVDKAKT